MTPGFGEEAQKIVDYKLAHPDMTAAQIAEVFGKTKSAVEQVIHRARQRGIVPWSHRGRPHRGAPPNHAERPQRMKQEPMFTLADVGRADPAAAEGDDDDPEYAEMVAKIRALRDRAMRRAERYTAALKLLEEQ